MEKEILKNLEKISQLPGADPAQVQGGGGNTSAKLDHQIMAIKASGYKLNQITADSGYVLLNFAEIKKYFQEVDQNREVDFEKEATDVVLQNIVSEKKLKPSVETGFHSVLDKYVIHTHSVYANILCCAQNGRELMEEAFAGEKISPLWIEYTHPGFDLTLKMMKAKEKYQQEYDKNPVLIFIENHGPVVTHQSAGRALVINDFLNEKIRDFLSLEKPFPEVVIEKIADRKYRSAAAFLKDFILNEQPESSYFEKILYPDQIVYMGRGVSYEDENSRIYIDTERGEVIYNCGEKEAQTIAETLTAYVYTRSQIDKNNFTLQTMSAEHIKLIENMKAEKHRKKIMEDN